MLEVGSDSLNFLDVTIIIKEKHLTFDWYQKINLFGKVFKLFFKSSYLSKEGYNFWFDRQGFII